MRSRALLALSVLYLASASPVTAQSAPAKPLKLVADLGYVNASGNSNLSTLNLGEKLTWTPAGSKFSLNQYAAYVTGSTNEKESANRLGLGGRGTYKLSARLSAFAGLDFERDPFAGVDRRFTELVGLGWTALDAPRNKFSLEGGATFVQATYTEPQDDGTLDDRYATWRLAGTYRWLFGDKAYFQWMGEYLPGFEKETGYRFNTEAALVAPINRIVALKTTYLLRYNSNPPSDFKTTDRTFTTGIQVTP